MQTSRRPNKLKGFGLVDAMVGLLLLVMAGSALFLGFSSLLTLSSRQTAIADQLIDSTDKGPYASWF